MRIAFQNHDHSYMRSKLLRNNEENTFGTLYIGNGAWGVTPGRRRNSNPTFYVEEFEERK